MEIEVLFWRPITGQNEVSRLRPSQKD